MKMVERLNVIARREDRLDSAYWMEVHLIDDLIREYTPEHELELHYWRLERIAALIERCDRQAVELRLRHRFIRGYEVITRSLEKHPLRCDSVSPISKWRCTNVPRHAGWHNSGLATWNDYPAPTGSRIEPDPAHGGPCQHTYTGVCECPY